MRSSTLAFVCLAGLLTLGTAYADDGETKRPRASRHAVLKRATDAAGDRHERVLHQVAQNRSLDHVGDAEVARRFRAGHRGQAIQHARLDRAKDSNGDLRVQAVASLRHNARRAADLRRTRDLRGDLDQLTAWKNYRIRHGNLSREVYQIGQDARNAERARYLDQRDPRSGADTLSTDDDRLRRDERRDERDEEREVNGHSRRTDSDGLDNGDRELEREEEKLEAELEAEVEREEDEADRELDREEEAAEAQEERDIERQINNEETSLEEDAEGGDN